jgi:hypothetical protein
MRQEPAAGKIGPPFLMGAAKHYARWAAKLTPRMSLYGVDQHIAASYVYSTTPPPALHGGRVSDSLNDRSIPIAFGVIPSRTIDTFDVRNEPSVAHDLPRNVLRLRPDASESQRGSVTMRLLAHGEAQAQREA